MIKKEELSNPNSCLNKAMSDEPVFVLKATDPLAPITIRHWATMSEGTQSEEKLREAENLADLMDEYRTCKRNEVVEVQEEQKTAFLSFSPEHKQIIIKNVCVLEYSLASFLFTKYDLETARYDLDKRGIILSELRGKILKDLSKFDDFTKNKDQILEDLYYNWKIIYNMLRETEDNPSKFDVTRPDIIK